MMDLQQLGFENFSDESSIVSSLESWWGHTTHHQWNKEHSSCNKGNWKWQSGTGILRTKGCGSYLVHLVELKQGCGWSSCGCHEGSLYYQSGWGITCQESDAYHDESYELLEILGTCTDKES